MEPGAFRLDFTWIGSSIDTQHDVAPSQYEPGIPLEDQPRVHYVDLQLNTLISRLSYSVTRRLALELEVPLRSVQTDAAFEDVNGVLREDFTSIHHRDETVDGVGDVVLASRWRLSQGASRSSDSEDASPRRWLADLVTGISIPTGGTEEDPFLRGSLGLEHQHVFFGSGTWDPTVRLELYRRGDRANVYTWIGGSSALSTNSKGYRRGFSGSAGAGSSTRFGLARWSFQAQLELQHSEPSTWRSQAALNSGRTDLVAGLGAAYELQQGLTLRGQLQLPENVSSRTGVLEPSTVALFGVSYSRLP